MKKILLIGKDGQVGWELQRSLAVLGEVIACDRQKADLTNPDALIALVRDIKPQIIVNAGAYTAVDKAETECDLAMQINGKAPGVLAEEAKRLKATFVHYSTDYVFNGQSHVPYSENDTTAPLNVYGQTKLIGENSIQAVGGNYLIFRTSWVYGMRGKNFLLTMLKLAKEKKELKIVTDQIGAPTWSRLIAQATAQALGQCIEEKCSGIYNMTAAGQTSWKQFAEEIFKIAGSETPIVKGIPSSEYPLPAKRPAFSVLSNQKLNKTFGISLPSWGKGLQLCML